MKVQLIRSMVFGGLKRDLLLGHAHLEKFPSSAARETGYEEMFVLTKGTLDPGSKRQVEKT